MICREEKVPKKTTARGKKAQAEKAEKEEDEEA